MKVISVVGARPNFIKVAPLIEAINKYNRDISSERKKVFHTLIHTGQHYDYRMSAVFFKELEIPKPNIFLNIGSATHAVQTARILLRLEKVLLKKRPDLVIVYGDVNSTLAAALTATKLHIKIAHVEAGLRSFDKRMPEEINRILTDQISDYLFTDCKDANNNLIRENLEPKKIYFVGNIMVDTLLKYKDKLKNSGVLKNLKLENQDYALLTLHRPENIDYPDILSELCQAFGQIQKKIKIIFPMHPHTQKNIQNFRLMDKLKKMMNLIIIKPLGYIDFLRLMKQTKFVFTDSGGIQEETAMLDIPCLTLRQTTERPITIKKGTNILVGHHKRKIILAVDNILNGKRKYASPIQFWDGLTASRIIDALLR